MDLVPVEALTSPREYFRCLPLTATLPAGVCLARQAQSMGDCARCPLGAQVVARLGPSTAEPVVQRMSAARGRARRTVAVGPYASLAEASRATGITVRVLTERLRKMSPEQALAMGPTVVRTRIWTEQIEAAAKRAGVAPSTIQGRLAQGLTIEEATAAGRRKQESRPGYGGRRLARLATGDRVSTFHSQGENVLKEETMPSRPELLPDGAP